MGKRTFGLIERIVIKGEHNRELYAKVDTGARMSSMDVTVATELGLGPLTRTKVVKSSLGKKLRPVLRVRIQIGDAEIEEEFSLADRSDMQYPVLIGLNVLSKLKVLVDTTKGNESLSH